MPETIPNLLQRHVRNGIVLDSNILLVYLLGHFRRELIPKYKRTMQYTIEDYDLLRHLLHGFRRIVTTPNLLTEVSNLANQLPETIRDTFYAAMARYLEVMDERYLESRHLAGHERFSSAGLADTSVLNLGGASFLVLTDDFRLSQILLKRGCDVINFNHVREL